MCNEVALIRGANIVVLHTFEVRSKCASFTLNALLQMFVSAEESLRVWRILRENLQKNTIVITLPSLTEQLDRLRQRFTDAAQVTFDFDNLSWTKPVHAGAVLVQYCTQDLNKVDDLKDLHAYIVC